MWVDPSKKNGSKPEFVFTCNNRFEEVLHSNFHGRNFISSAHSSESPHETKGICNLTAVFWFELLLVQ